MDIESWYERRSLLLLVASHQDSYHRVISMDIHSLNSNSEWIEGVDREAIPSPTISQCEG